MHDQLAKRLARDGHEVVFIVPNFPGGKTEEYKNGYKIIRVGNGLTVYWKAFRLYRKQFKGWADLVVDSYFVVPFFAKYYVREKNMLIVHNLCREIWWYQMWFPASLVGYLLEPLYLRLISDMKVITFAESTRRELESFGFRNENISIISEGIEIEPVATLDEVYKFDKPTILSLGSIRAMKRTDHIVRAFEILKKDIPEAQLIVAGKPDGAYGRRVMKMINRSPYEDSIEYLGAVSKEQKIELMRRSHVIAVTSVKEGWGLIVTEANSQGTPAVVYDADGLRDSVRDNQTGLVCSENTPNQLADKLDLLFDLRAISDVSSHNYVSLQKKACAWSKLITFDKSYSEFLHLIV